MMCISHMYKLIVMSKFILVSSIFLSKILSEFRKYKQSGNLMDGWRFVLGLNVNWICVSFILVSCNCNLQ